MKAVRVAGVEREDGEEEARRALRAAALTAGAGSQEELLLLSRTESGSRSKLTSSGQGLPTFPPKETYDETLAGSPAWPW